MQVGGALCDGGLSGRRSVVVGIPVAGIAMACITMADAELRQDAVLSPLGLSFCPILTRGRIPPPTHVGQVRTRLLAMIDVDMYMSRSLSEEMAQRGSVERYEALCAERRATVLPAFEPTKPGAAGRVMATNLSCVSKAQLQLMHGRNKAAIQFKLRVFPRGHTPTDYVRWFASSEPYQVTYKRFYEPWFITCDEIMPWYDIDFRGYGMNKIVLIAALNYYNYSFWIHPSAWLVHNPHGDTEVRKLVAREASDVNKLNVKLPANALYRKLTILFGKAKRGMVRGGYDPRVDPRQLSVYDRLPWLRRPPKLVGSPTPESVFT
ncbi:hypothetical protein GPECTOR_44g80 [Gonium pectorale]|uniref:Uncharacterized protein n=1 Tax=Gonium pectorale TaxID=33097 RepID=A0A150G976_GONPE|nr:hypothetical protein GPECTOR_44g80 [Gonium pectorale]|eukprot:KXZ46406.1 hypothetical protein GPECTOR_44g80 [Gonium pectorale]